MGAVTAAVATRMMEVRRRFDRELELTIAIHTEIVAGLRRAGEQTVMEEVAYAEDDQDPFAVADETDFVFEAVKADPAMLPKEVIHSVVRYYKLAAQTNAMTKAFSAETFKAQSNQSKRKFVRQLLDLMTEQQGAGVLALADLENAAVVRNEHGLSKFRHQAGIADIKSEA